MHKRTITTYDYDELSADAQRFAIKELKRVYPREALKEVFDEEAPLRIKEALHLKKDQYQFKANRLGITLTADNLLVDETVAELAGILPQFVRDYFLNDVRNNALKVALVATYDNERKPHIKSSVKPLLYGAVTPRDWLARIMQALTIKYESLCDNLYEIYVGAVSPDDNSFIEEAREDREFFKDGRIFR